VPPLTDESKICKLPSHKFLSENLDMLEIRSYGTQHHIVWYHGGISQKSGTFMNNAVKTWNLHGIFITVLCH